MRRLIYVLDFCYYIGIRLGECQSKSWWSRGTEKSLGRPYRNFKGKGSWHYLLIWSADFSCHGLSSLLSWSSVKIHVIMPSSSWRHIWSVRMAEQLALPTSDHGVAGLNPAGGEILPKPKQRFIAQSLSCSSFHRLEMTEILLKGRKTLTHPSILGGMKPINKKKKTKQKR